MTAAEEGKRESRGEEKRESCSAKLQCQTAKKKKKKELATKDTAEDRLT